jgi:hypothetical protein
MTFIIMMPKTKCVRSEMRAGVPQLFLATNQEWMVFITLMTNWKKDEEGRIYTTLKRTMMIAMLILTTPAK